MPDNKLKYNFEQLVIEVGRKCNMKCNHCLRGDAEDLAIKKEYIDAVLQKTDSIGCLTITGGEPFLYPEEIHYIIDRLQFYNIPLCNFFIATNGTVTNFDILHDIMTLYSLCDEPEMCSLKISVDKYHGNQSYWRMLDALTFTESDANINITDNKYLIAEGRAAENYRDILTRHPHDDKPSFDMISDKNIMCVYEGLIYLNANGHILTGCDYSYENQKDHIRGDLNKNTLDIIIEDIMNTDEDDY